jgi:hypothetical protein
MSAHYVRSLTEAWLIAIGSPPYHGTVNYEVAPVEPVWMTAEWNSFGATKETFCETFVEDGEIRLMFFGLPGVGWDALIQTAETASAQFFQNIDTNQKLTLTVLDPPDEFASQSEPWFIVEVSVTYQYRK